MIAQNTPDPLASSNRPLRTVLIGTTLEDDSDRIVRSALAVARALRRGDGRAPRRSALRDPP